jgi:hypothetical protein
MLRENLNNIMSSSEWKQFGGYRYHLYINEKDKCENHSLTIESEHEKRGLE